MKFITIFAFTFLSFHFTYGQTNQDTQKIISEILAITKKYNKAWDSLNMNTVAKFHSDKSFRYYRYGTLAVSSNAEFKKMAPIWMEETKSLEAIEFTDPVVQVLSKDIAMISFKGTAKIIFKNGNEELDSNTATYLWQKENNEWKIVHIHESKK